MAKMSQVILKEKTMSKKNPCGLDFCPYKEIAGEYASCVDCAWAEDDSNNDEREDNEDNRC